MHRVYKIKVIFNWKHFNEIWIDPHYEEKHSDSIDDNLILAILHLLPGEVEIVVEAASGFKYYEVDTEFLEKSYRLILVTPIDESYLGVRNAYRRSK